MMDKNIKTVGLFFVETVADKELTKDKLFEQLYKTIGHRCELTALGLPSASAVAYLESNKAKYQIKAYQPRIADTFNRLNKAEKICDKKELLDRLNMLTPKPRDYAVIALDCYLKMDRGNTVQGFYSEYQKYAAKQQRNGRMANNNYGLALHKYQLDGASAIS